MRPYLWGLVFLSCCCGNNSRSWGRTTQRVVPAAGDLWPSAAELWGDHKAAACTHTHPDVKHLSRHVLCCSRTLTHKLHETTAFMLGTDPQSNTISGERSHKWPQQSVARLDVDAEDGKLGWRAVSHCFSRTPTKQAGAKDKWEKQHQWLHLWKNPKGPPCVLEQREKH